MHVYASDKQDGRTVCYSSWRTIPHVSFFSFTKSLYTLYFIYFMHTLLNFPKGFSPLLWFFYSIAVFLYFFWWAWVRWPILCLCRFMTFEGCLDSSPSKRAQYTIIACGCMTFASLVCCIYLQCYSLYTAFKVSLSLVSNYKNMITNKYIESIFIHTVFEIWHWFSFHQGNVKEQ